MGKHDIVLNVKQKGAAKTTSSMNKLTSALKGVVGAYVGIQTARQAIGFISSATKQFFRQSTVLQRMGAILKLVPDYTSETAKEMQNLAERLQQVGVLGDDVTEAFISQMASFKLSAENIRKLIPAAQDYIVATYGINAGQEQAIQTANSLGKAYMGQAGMLARTGIIMSDVQKEMLKNGNQAEQTATLVNVLNDNYKGLNKELAKTPEGKRKTAMNAFGDAMEAVGDKFWKEGGLGEAMEGMTNFFQSEAGTEFAKSVGTSFGKVAKVLTDVLRLMNLIESKNQQSLRESRKKAGGQRESIQSDKERIRQLDDIIKSGGGSQSDIDERNKLKKGLPSKKAKFVEQNNQTIKEADRVIAEATAKLDRWWVKAAYMVTESTKAIYDRTVGQFDNSEATSAVKEVADLNRQALADMNDSISDLKQEVENIQSSK